MSGSEDDNVSGGEEEDTKKKKTGKRKKTAKKGPKRPLSAYMFFCKDKRAEVKQETGASFSELGKLLGGRWQKLSDEEKRPYEEQNEKDKKRYEAEKENFPDDEADEPKSKRAKTKGGKKKGPPKAPSAYLLFAADERAKLKEEGKGLNFTEQGKEIGKRWGMLSESEKKVYTDKAKEKKKEHEKVIEDWVKENGPLPTKTKKKKAKSDEDAPKKSKKKKEKAKPKDDDSAGDDDAASGGDDD